MPPDCVTTTSLPRIILHGLTIGDADLEQALVPELRPRDIVIRTIC
jgi:hypothetical protein